MKRWRARQWVVGLALISLSAAACTRTLAAGPERELAPAVTRPPSSPTATPVATASAAADCVDDARFLEDLTVPDGSAVAPGEPVDKRWSMLNSGDCDWGPGYRLVPRGDNPLAAESELALYPAKAGSKAIWRVAFDAPEAPGEYIGEWVAINPAGEPFGSPVFTLIVVDEAASPAGDDEPG